MINRAVLTGRLTKDVEIKKTQNGTSVASFTIAVDRFKKTDPADFIACVAWKGSADYIASYGHKGSMVAVEGRIQTRTYNKQDGTKQYITEVITDNVQVMDSKPKDKFAPDPEHEKQAADSLGIAFGVDTGDLDF